MSRDRCLEASGRQVDRDPVGAGPGAAPLLRRRGLAHLIQPQPMPAQCVEVRGNHAVIGADLTTQRRQVGISGPESLVVVPGRRRPGGGDAGRAGKARVQDREHETAARPQRSGDGGAGTVEIVDGLAPGDELVVNPADSLEDGQQVNIAAPKQDRKGKQGGAKS